MITAKGNTSDPLTVSKYNGSARQHWKLVPINVDPVPTTATTKAATKTTTKTTTKSTTTTTTTTTTATTAMTVPLPPTGQNVTPRTYTISNAKNGFVLTHQSDVKLGNFHPIGIELNEGLASQCFALTHVNGGKYTLTLGDDSSLFVNCAVKNPEDVSAGVKISSYTKYTDGTQYFWFTPAGNGQYYIQCSLDKSLVLAPSSDICGAGLVLQKFDGSALQKWNLTPVKPVETTTAKVTATTTTKTTTSATKPVTTTTTATTAYPVPAKQQNITPGDYSFMNAQNGYCMTHQTAYSVSAAHPIGIELNEDLLTQRYTLKYIADGKYSLALGDDPALFVNCTCKTADDIKAGVEITGWKEYTDGTQYFYLTEVCSGQFILRLG